MSEEMPERASDIAEHTVTSDDNKPFSRDRRIEGLGDQPKAGRPRRLTTEDGSRIISLVRQAPPGRLERRAGELVARDGRDRLSGV
jgi:hypothetical protein